MSEDYDLILIIQRDPAGQLGSCTVGHTAVAHLMIVGLPGNLKDAILTVEICKILEPLFIYFKFR